ncbi:hypothetical protein D3C81_2141780 [compost metagenome]
MKLYDPDHKLFKELETNKKGEEEVEIQQTGSYKLEVVGDGAKGSYKVSYKTKKSGFRVSRDEKAQEEAWAALELKSRK